MGNESIDALLNEGEQLISQNRLREARDHYAGLSRNYPDNSEVWFSLGLITLELEGAPAAVTCLETAIQVDPGHVESYVQLAGLRLQLNDTVTALRLAQRATEIDQEYAEAWLALGKVHAVRQDYRSAEQSLRQAIRLWPECAEAHFDLSTVLQQLGRMVEALQVCVAGLDQQPNHSVAWRQRAQLEETLELYGEAEQSSRKAIGLDPFDSQVRLVLARNLLLLQRPIDALEEFSKIIAVTPGNAQAWQGLAVVYESLGRLDDAAEALRHALEIEPATANGWFLLAMLDYQRGDLEKALCYCERASKINPVYEPSRVLQGDILRTLGRLEESLAAYESILNERHGELNLNAVAGKVMVLDKQGQHEAAYGLLRPFLETGRTDYRVAFAYAGLCQYAGDCDDAVGILEGLLSGGDAGANPRQTAHYRHEAHNHLGKLYDRVGDHDRAFPHFKAANEYKKRTAPFNPERHHELIDGIVADYTRDRIRHAPHSGLATERPVFVLGMPRSGTSLVEQILCSHPQVYGGGELQDLQMIAADLDSRHGTNLVRPPLLRDLSESGLREAGERYLQTIDRLSAAALRITDKMPYNFFHMGLIQILFPRCRIVHCVRDPMDTCLSIYFQNFSGYQGFATDLHWVGLYYNAYRKLMHHWSRELDLAVHIVSYESLVEHQEQETRRLLEFCGLDWDPACLEFYRNPRIALTASYNQIRRPLYRSSRQRWKNYQKYLGHLKQLLESGQENRRVQ